MSYISTCSARINSPRDFYASDDKIGLWLRQPMTRAQLKQHGAYDCTPRDLVRRFRLAYGQLIQIPQPKVPTLEYLADRNDAHLNYVEEGLDWVYDDAADKHEGFWSLHRHVVKRHHGTQQVLLVFGTTRYTGPRRAPNVLAIYHDKPCRVTGEVDCVHLDWRIRGAAALRRAGIHSVRDLLTLDRRKFWAQRLLLFDVNSERLGRRYHNWQMGTHRRQPWVERFGPISYDHDGRAGQIIARALTVQGIVDAYTRRFDVRSCLIPIAVADLLPGSLL